MTAADQDAAPAAGPALPSVSRSTDDRHVHYVRAGAVRWVDINWPGWVEVHLHESDGTVAVLVDKVPIFDDGDRLAPRTTLPVEIEIPCDVLQWVVDAAGNRVSLIRLRSDVEDRRGRRTFHVDERILVSSS